jgi:hypothetical protein
MTTIVDELDHEIACLKGIELAIVGLNEDGIIHDSSGVRHLLQNSIDVLTRLAGEVQGLMRIHPVNGTTTTKPVVEEIEVEILAANGIVTAINGLECLDQEQKEGVAHLQQAHIYRLESARDRMLGKAAK